MVRMSAVYYLRGIVLTVSRVACTTKLQQWDILMDLAKAEGNLDLQLDCAWRITDWSAEKEWLTGTVMSLGDRKFHLRPSAFLTILQNWVPDKKYLKRFLC
jgi:phosphatidylinositol kinase/protein kinase (PI-3  family)